MAEPEPPPDPPPAEIEAIVVWESEETGTLVSRKVLSQDGGKTWQ